MSRKKASQARSKWSQMASACSCMKLGLVPWPDIEVEERQWEHQILAARPVVSVRALALWFAEEELSQRRKVVKQVKCLLGGKKEYVWIDTWVDSESQSHALVVVWSLIWSIFFWVSFGQPFLFPWLRVHNWCILGSSYVFAHISQPRQILL